MSNDQLRIFLPLKLRLRPVFVPVLVLVVPQLERLERLYVGDFVERGAVVLHNMRTQDLDILLQIERKLTKLFCK